MEEDFNSINVLIAGSKYTIKSDLEPEEIESIANYVDIKISQIGSGQTSRERYKIAILAAIQITGELFEARHAKEDLTYNLEQVDKKIIELNKKIDQI